MSQPQLNQRLTSLDASFLYVEKPEAPMHVGSIAVFDGEVPYEEFVANVESKLHLLPRYRQKITPVPFNLGHPVWEVDPNFNIRNHIKVMQIDQPGDEEQLSILGGKLLSGMMDRSKPLWEIFIIHGLAGGQSAIVSRVHHAMIDGISGVDLTKLTYDISPNPPPLPEKPDTTAAPVASQDMTKNLIEGWLSSVQERMDSWTTFQTGLLNLTEAVTRDPSRWFLPPSLTTTANMLPSMATPVNMLPFNKPNTPGRRLVWSVISFAEARAIRAALGGTVNDVVLTVLSGAIMRYVQAHREKTNGRMMRIMVPVSMRREEQRGALGNLVSVLPVEIPMDIDDAVARLHYITGKTGELKSAKVAEGLNVFTALLGTVPAPLQALFGTLASSRIPPFNTVCTNVPGPQIPLYALGKRMLSWYPYVPIGYAMGVGCAIMSYDGKLFFGLTADTGIMPDVTLLKEFLEQAFEELREAAKNANKDH